MIGGWTSNTFKRLDTLVKHLRKMTKLMFSEIIHQCSKVTYRSFIEMGSRLKIVYISVFRDGWNLKKPIKFEFLYFST